MNDIATFIEAEKKEFEKRFPHLNDSTNEGGYFAQPYVLDFLEAHDKRLLAKVREVVESKLREVKPLYTFGDLVIDSQRMQDGTILGQQKSLTDILSLLPLQENE